MSRRKEVKKLDAVFSKYIRNLYADKAGRTKCITCGVLKPVAEMHAGHFMSRSKYSTRWMHDPSTGMVNVLPQCPRCNLYDSSQSYKFGRKLDAIYGEGTAEKVHQASQQMSKFSLTDIVAMRKMYEQKLKDL